ncbi:MAG: SsrA-binding protein SmpB [Candidatus Marinimicrobia bacterium]|nr:SsrA-binding protein SmpB [Candidatus Neomarinimicrobiota bacterium]
MPLDDKTITVNRKARYDYHILKTMEAGLSLLGTEIKSIREGRVSIREAYVRPQDDELWLVGAHVAQYPPASGKNHDPTRNRRLLLHRKEIEKLTVKIREKRLTMIPLKIYFNHGGRVKLLIGVGRGKQTVDRRQDEKKSQAKKEMAQALKHANRS